MRISAMSFNTGSFKIKASNILVSPSSVMDNAKKQDKQKVNLGQGNTRQVNGNSKGNGLSDVLKSIQQRKEKIIESKNELIDKALSEGKTLADISHPLEMYNEQLNNLEKEIQNAIAAELEKKAEKKDSNKIDDVNKVEKPKTQEELEAQRLKETTMKLARADVIEGDMSLVKGMKARVRVLESEIKQDRAFRSDYAQRIVRLGGGRASVSLGNATSKEKEIAHLNKKINEIGADAIKEAKEINKDIIKKDEAIPVKEEE